MWPTAKIARAIVVEPPESSNTLRLISAAESKYSHHSAAASTIAAATAIQPEKCSTWPADLARLDQDLAEHDDQEQAEALGEVVRVERLRGVGGLERGEVAVAAQPVRRLAVLGQRRVGLHPMAIAHRT